MRAVWIGHSKFIFHLGYISLQVQKGFILFGDCHTHSIAFRVLPHSTQAYIILIFIIHCSLSQCCRSIVNILLTHISHSDSMS
jgi:hypothetical protein